MDELKTDVFSCKCKKCKHEWIKRIKAYPRMCPKCKSYDWKDYNSFEDDDEEGIMSEEEFNKKESEVK